MKQFWQNIPRTLQITVIVSIILLAAASVVSGIVVNPGFGGQTAVVGGFSVALLCVYVVWTGRVMSALRDAAASSESGDVPKEAAESATLKLQIGSVAKFLALSAVLILLVVAFHFDVMAALVGVSAYILPFNIVPLFVKPRPEDDESDPSDDMDSHDPDETASADSQEDDSKVEDKC